MITIGVIFLLAIILMIAGLPVGVCFGFGGLVALWVNGLNPTWALVSTIGIVTSFAFLALPLYMLLGAILCASGMSEKLADFGISLVGMIRGGLGVALIIANAIFGAMSGAALSALGSMGQAFLPELERQGYPKNYAIAILIPSAVISTLIPPSGFMIIFGFMGRLSIAKCFLAGAVPGLILVVMLSVIHLIMCRNIPTIYVPPRVSVGGYFKQVGKSGYRNFLTLLIPVTVLGVIYGGFGTPTESAGIASIYAFLIAFVAYRTLSFRASVHAITGATKMIGSIMILLFFFLVVSRVLIIEQVSSQILAVMMRVSEDKWALMLMLNVLMLFMGMVMDDDSTAIIAAIILLPIAVAIGFNPYHFAAICCVNLELGLITPPVAPLLYLGGHLAGDMPLSQYIKPVLIFIIFAFLPILLLTIFIPEIGTFLPGLFGRGGV